MNALAKSFICSLQNWQRTRQYEASLSVRQEGFTEDWGDRSNRLEEKSASNQEQHAASTTKDLPCDPKAYLGLVQYRPAWVEQLILKLCRVPFRLSNSAYAVTELTGPLPYVQDGTAMAGGHDDILSYISIRHGTDDIHQLFPSKLSAHQRLESELLVSWIQQQVLIPFSAHRAEIGKKPTGNWWISSLQHWAESVLVDNRANLSKEAWLEKTRKAYRLLDNRLENNQYLLSTECPAYVDCLLWGHLMEAVCHVDLILLLHDFPNLVSFLQNIYSRYHFGSATGDLEEWNIEENAANVFMGDHSSLPCRSAQFFKTATDTAHRLRQQQEFVPREDPMVTFHRWRRGGSMMPPSKAIGKEPPSKFHDDVWLISVVAATVALVFGFGFPESS